MNIHTLLCLSVALPLPMAVLATDADQRTRTAASEQAYQQPLSGLDPTQLEQFEEGRKGFAQHWAVAPSILGLWGRGPTSNGESCTDCHENGGRGRATDSTETELPSMLVRLSISGEGSHGAPRPDPDYGDQLQE